MYKELRRGGSTPTMWSKNFLSGAELRLIPPETFLTRDDRWRAIRARMQPGQRVLDAGCGNGDWVEFLADQGMFATGLDFSSELVDVRRQARPDLTWLHGDIRDIPLPDQSLDGIVSWGVIEHDEAGPQAALREFHRVIRPGGWLFVTVPIDSPNHRNTSEVSFGDQRHDGTFFQYYFTRAELTAETSNAGFEVNEVVPSGSHFAVSMPHLYKSVCGWPRLARSAPTHALNTYVKVRRNSSAMYLSIARRL